MGPNETKFLQLYKHIPPEYEKDLARWGDREFLFEQFLKIHHNSRGEDLAESVNADLTKDFGGMLIAAGFILLITFLAFHFIPK